MSFADANAADANAADSHSAETEVNLLADALASRFEELALIHGLTHRLASTLTLTEQSSEVARSLLEELAPCIESSTLAIHLFPNPKNAARATFGSSGRDWRCPDEIFELVGEPLSDPALLAIADATRKQSKERTGDSEGVALVNDVELDSGKTLRVTIVPIQRGNNSLGQMIAIRSPDQREFGTIEAEMMLSTSMMLAIHILNQRQYQQMQSMFESMIQSLASALDAKDTYTCGHSNRVADLSVELASRLGYDDSALANIRMGGILHDIGKIGVDDCVLRKTTTLTDDEFEQIKRHPVLGYEILKGVDQFGGILPAVRHHHESWDGTGYPDGLAGESIPRDAQIVAVADAFDAMISDRPYRPGMPIERVTQILRDGRGTQWAADVVDVLLAHPELTRR